MGIGINDLDDNLNPRGASLLSGNDTVLDNLRELSDEELKTSGGGKDDLNQFIAGRPKKGTGGPTVVGPSVRSCLPVGYPPIDGKPFCPGPVVGDGGLPVGGGDSKGYGYGY